MLTSARNWVKIAMMQNLLLGVISFFVALTTTQVSAENLDWMLVATTNNHTLQIKKSSVTKIQNSLVFDGFTYLDIGTGSRSLDRYIVSCDGNSAAQLSRVHYTSTDFKDRQRWLNERDTTILANTNSLVIDTEFFNEYWFITQSFKLKIQSMCKGRANGLKNVEASIASSSTSDGKVETHVLLLDSLRSSSKYREIWATTYDVDKKPILVKDPATGESTQAFLNDKPQYEKSPVGNANSRTRYRFQCDQKKIASAQSVVYSKSGLVTSSQNLTEAQLNLNLTEVVPMSISEALLEFVCAL